MLQNSISEKEYNLDDLTFLEQCVIYCDSVEIEYIKMSKALSGLFNTSPQKVEQKMKEIKEILNEEHHINTLPSPTPQCHDHSKSLVPSSKPLKNIQNIHEDMNNTKRKSFTKEDIGKVFMVRVTNIKPYGAFCTDYEGKTGLVLKSLIADHFVTNVEDYLCPGDEFQVMVIEDKEKPNKTLLSARAVGNIIPIFQRFK